MKLLALNRSTFPKKKRLLQFVLVLMVVLTVQPEAWAQKKEKKPKVKHEVIFKAMTDIRHAYNNGKDDKGRISVMGRDEIERIIGEVETLVKDTAQFLAPTERFPIVRSLFGHYLAGVQETPNFVEACRHLKEADAELIRLNNPKVVIRQRKDAILKDYKDYFGLDVPLSLANIYTSDFCRAYSIKKGAACPFASDPIEPPKPKEAHPQIEMPMPPPPPPVPSPTIRKGAGGLSYTIFHNDSTVIRNGNDQVIAVGKSPEKAIRQCLNKGVFHDSLLSVSPFRAGKFGEIALPKDSHGNLYQVLLKSTEKEDTLLFGPGQYQIHDFRVNGEGERWSAYDKSLREFNAMLFDFIDDFGPEAIEFVLIGSADAAPFRERKLTKGVAYDFSAIPFTNYRTEGDKTIYFPDTMRVGNLYDNSELPNLRAAFMKWALAQEPAFQKFEHRIRILKGVVKPGGNIKDRHCAILLYINWDVVNRKFKSDPKRPYSPFQAQP